MPLKRTGFSLIELLAVLAVASLIAAIVTSLLFSMMQQNAAMGSQIRLANNQRRLAQSFRRDVQQAQSLELNAPAAISLLGPQGKATYAYLEPNTIRRSSATVGPRQDDFELEPGHEVVFSTETLDNRQLVTLAIRRRTDLQPADQPRFPVASAGLTTVAELARDHRWRTEARNR